MTRTAQRSPAQSTQAPTPRSAHAPSAGYPAPWSNQQRIEELGLQGGVDPHDTAAWELGGPFTPLLVGFAAARAAARAAAAPPTVPDDPRALALALIEAAIRGEAPPAPPPTQPEAAAPEAGEARAANLENDVQQAIPDLSPEGSTARAPAPEAPMSATALQTGRGAPWAAEAMDEAMDEALRFVESAVFDVVQAGPAAPATRTARATSSPTAAPQRRPPPVAPELEGVGPRRPRGASGGDRRGGDRRGGEAGAGHDDRRHASAAGGDRGRLDRLLSKDPMTVAQIAEARTLIEALPEEQRAEAYREVQARSPYLNQRENNDRREGASGGTCFPTAVAMALMSLGVPNPDPSRRYPDAIMAMAPGDITAVATWIKVCARLGKAARMVDGSEINTWPKEKWQRRLDALLGGGGAAVLSLGGHVVRVEGFDEHGLKVDDPYGQSRIGAGSERGWHETNATDGEGTDRGEGHDYPWAQTVKHTFNYLLTIR